MQPVTAAERRDPLRLTAIIITFVLHAGIFGGAWIARVVGNRQPPALKDNFVDAQLVRFGKPRDLSFLPHKQGRVKDKPPEIKVAKDINALPKPPEEKNKADVDPLKKTHAEVFKQMNEDNEGVEATNEGALPGSRAGTATEAKGDPYILSLIDQIGTAWTVPTTLKDAELANLSADVCLTIADSGALTNYNFVRKSGNSQFDSSLDATLSTIKKLPPPPDRWRNAASRGRLCPTFSKQ
jgi:TonB C terminal